MTKEYSLEQIASQIRRDIVRMVTNAESGHPGGSLSSTDFLTVLFFKKLNCTPETWTREGKDQDMFFLSAGHITPVYYSTLARCGYFPVEELSTFRKIGTRLQGHPSIRWGLPGVHQAAGSLGQGISVAIGAALAKKLNNDDNYVYVLLGDGESQEGQVWEAALFASHHKVDNLIAITDYNGQQIDGRVEDVLGFTHLKEKWEAFGWEVIEADGHDMEKIDMVFD